MNDTDPIFLPTLKEKLAILIRVNILLLLLVPGNDYVLFMTRGKVHAVNGFWIPVSWWLSKDSRLLEVERQKVIGESFFCERLHYRWEANVEWLLCAVNSFLCMASMKSFYLQWVNGLYRSEWHETRCMLCETASICSQRWLVCDVNHGGGCMQLMNGFSLEGY